MTLALTTAGESHGAALVAILTGLPAGLDLDRAAIDDDPDLLWVAVRALSSDPGEPLPVAALALMADLAGVGPFRV